MEQLRPGVTVLVWWLDRLGRSIRYLIDQLSELQERGIEFRSLQENIDTSSPGGRLVFHIFASLAEFERDLFRERTNASSPQRGPAAALAASKAYYPATNWLPLENSASNKT